MAKTVLIGGNNIVDNVIKLAPGTPYDPGPGISMLVVSDDTHVGPGMLYVEGSSPAEFRDAPASGDPNAPSSQSEAIERAQALFAQGNEMLALAQTLG